MTVCLINLVNLDPPINGGMSRVAREVTRALLEETPSTFHASVVVGARFFPKFKRWLSVQHRFSAIPYSRYVPAQLILQWIRPDVIVSPLFGVEPFTWVGSIPHIVSIPDTLIFDHPELFDANENRLRRESYQRAVSATRIVTLSEYARQQLSFHLRLAPDQTRVIRLGADGLPSSKTQPIPPPYAYYPANTWQHKRHDLLLQTMALIWQKRSDVKLVFSGGRPPNLDLDALIARYAPMGKVIDLGHVSEMEIAGLYTHAEALLFTSQYEGFGIPILEAMRAGCPVLCAPVTAIPEVAGDAALYVDSEQPEVWADAFLNQLPQQRNDLIVRGYQQATKFTWAETRRRWVELVLSVVHAARADG
jgi:glycosyltransferase involved in cell wall biosynthesis